MSDELALRPASESDLDFLWQLHVATMRDYVEAIWGWDEDWQREHFYKIVQPAAHQIIVVDGEDVGTISIGQHDDAIYINNIEILPDWQNQGIGTYIITTILEDARSDGFPVALQVLKNNPAIRFYERLGFEMSDETETHYEMVNWA